MIIRRQWLVRWLYLVAAAHVAGGVMLVLLADAPVLANYHAGIEQAFWGAGAPAAARAQSQFWFGLFGPTMQCAAIWMAALVWSADRQRSAALWAALAAGLLVWAPQDIALSLRASVWPHVWIDLFALAITLPPLTLLWNEDRERPAA